MPLPGRADPGTGSGPPKYPGTFLLAFREAAAGLNWQIRRWTSQLVECADDKGRKQMVSLENLYRCVRPVPRDQWPARIAELLRTGTVPDPSREITGSGEPGAI
jgi:hypothetical protein